MSNDDINLLIEFNASEDSKAFLQQKNMTLEQINEINEKFQKSLERLTLDNETEDKVYFNKFIGRDWFKYQQPPKAVGVAQPKNLQK